MKGKKFLVVSLAALPLMITACNGGGQHDPSGDAVDRDDYTSVYDEIGSDVSIDMVEEKNGLAYATVNGTKYELGMDFLSMAMVYNCQVPANSTKYASEEDVYNEWWKLYIMRWNYLMPEIPLYSNQYYDLYANKLNGLVTSPYFSSADAINKTGSKDGKVILGNATALGGDFRNAAWGKSSAAASDLDIQNLTSGYSTVMSDINGILQWNLYEDGMGVLKSEPTKTKNADGTLTYTLEIQPGLKFSDDSEIKAKNYICGLLANATVVGVEAGGSGASGQTLVGYKDFRKDAETGKEFKGIKLFSDNEYKLSVTYTADYADYYYSMSLASMSPDPLKLYLGSAIDAIKTKEDGSVYLDSTFFAKDSEGKYTVAKEIKANLADNDPDHIPFSGPFMVKKDGWDKTAPSVTLVRNPKYPGDKFRGTAYEDDGTYKSIDEIKYIKIESETQNTKFEQGEVDVLDGITGGDDTKAALALVAAGKGKETHYDRAGYGKLGFRCDYGPTLFKGVRRAIAYSIDRPAFAETFTGGFGSVVDGPYYEGFSGFLANATYLRANLNKYRASVASAKAELEAEGWIYDKNGKEYKSGVRYKKLEGFEKTLDNLTFHSTDNLYKTEYVNGEYYMPCAINWYGTQPNDVTDYLITMWQALESSNAEIGMYVHYQSTDFITGLYGEYSEYPQYGFDGQKKLNAINFATGFNSALYDFAFNWTINQDYYASYSNNYLMDEADFYSTYHTPNAE